MNAELIIEHIQPLGPKHFDVVDRAGVNLEASIRRVEVVSTFRA